MCYYDIKPYNVLGFEYYGGSEFFIQIFNYFAVEVDYGLKDIPLECGIVSHNHLGRDVRKMLPISDCEVEKFCSTLSYNLNSTWSAAYEIFIALNHVKRKKYCEVLSLEACRELGFTSTMNWVELCFGNKKWHIILKWDDGHQYFSEESFDFIDDSRLGVGDLCLLRYTACWT